jgi:hypothetical protein
MLIHQANKDLCLWTHRLHNQEHHDRCGVMFYVIKPKWRPPSLSPSPHKFCMLKLAYSVIYNVQTGFLPAVVAKKRTESYLGQPFYVC